jgi:hypothetical protein
MYRHRRQSANFMNGSPLRAAAPAIAIGRAAQVERCCARTQRPPLASRDDWRKEGAAVCAVVKSASGSPCLEPVRDSGAEILGERGEHVILPLGVVGEPAIGELMQRTEPRELRSCDVGSRICDSTIAICVARAAGSVAMDRVLFVANHAFDGIGAKSAGMRTAFIDRRGRPYGATPHQPDIIVASMTELADLLGGRRAGECERLWGHGGDLHPERRCRASVPRARPRGHPRSSTATHPGAPSA